ncbi:cytochrome c3 family protein [Mariniblastus sp.]|nr:cytochrome c3 family protein [Mariniblastus sp.]
MSSKLQQWSLFLAVNLGLACWLGYALNSKASSVKTILLPGETTHGHYQIELACSACHAEDGNREFMENACINCHGDDLKESRDTHPAKKFSDPVHAETLTVLDATKCVTCHQEHVDHRTLDMGLTMPSDYCYQCHQETLKSRPSHANFAFDSCANAGCHNYHDNNALYERFLFRHYDEPDYREKIKTLKRDVTEFKEGVSLSADQADGFEERLVGTDAPAVLDPQILDDWATTAHALAGVNCSGCHMVAVPDDLLDESIADSSDEPTKPTVGGDDQAAIEPQLVWSDTVSHQVCATCHGTQVEGFLKGRHGMRLGSDLPAMTPAQARLKMHSGAGHEKLDCSACHSGHRFDTQYAAVEACIKCHADSHTVAYKDSSHFALFEAEMSGEAEAGTGVSCATCHMPRLEDDDDNVFVQHNQNNNLRPNEKMIREVCLDCHGMQFSLDSLADPKLIDQCFGGESEVYIDSIDMAKAWFDLKEQQKQERNRKRAEARAAKKAAEEAAKKVTAGQTSATETD